MTNVHPEDAHDKQSDDGEDDGEAEGGRGLDGVVVVVVVVDEGRGEADESDAREGREEQVGEELKAGIANHHGQVIEKEYR